MKKSIALVAVFLTVFAVNATADQLMVANTDLTLAGGVSATYNYVSDSDDADNFNVDTAIIHLFKNASTDSPVGGHLAVGTFHVKTPTGVNVAPDIGYGEFSPWLAYVSWMPAANVTVDEKGVANGGLKPFKALFIADAAISKKATDEILGI